MNHINICPSCIHRNICVLTAQKEKVWSCSEFDEEVSNISSREIVPEPKQHRKQELDLV
jgi:hypothetical protein